MRHQKTAVLILALFAGFFLLTEPARSQSSTHTVKKGDTLFGIADTYNVSVQEIKNWNDLRSNQLAIGQELVIRQGTVPSTPSSGVITHTVEPKETLFSIAKRYGVSIDDLRQWNDLQGSSLRIGSTLRVNPQSSAAGRSASSPARQSQSGGSYYTVKSGDSLFRIASQYDMSVDQLKQLNNLTSNTIQVGQQLAVKATDRPPSLAENDASSSAQGTFMRHRMEESMSRAALLEKYGMDEAEFSALNPGLRNTTFSRGDYVNILAPPTRTFSNPYVQDRNMESLGTIGVSRYSTQEAEPTTSGELYNSNALTAGHSSMALGSVIFLQNDSNNHGVFVRINDRITGDGMLISDAAWRALRLSGNEATVSMFRNNE